MKLRSPETYWLLKNGLRYTYPSLKEDIECDVLVVGGGITGALMAFHLSQGGCNTVLIDKNDVSLGSTSATTAILQYELDEPLYSLIGKVGERAAVDTYRHGVAMIDWLSDVVHRLHFDCGFEMKNSVYFARTKEDLDWLRQEFECRRSFGLGVQWLTASQLLKHYHIDGHGAILSDKAATVDAYALTHQLLHHAVTQHGLRVFDHTPMTEVSFDGHRNVIRTDMECQVTCKNIVYATGYESQAFLAERVATLVSTYALVSEPLKVVPPAISTSVFWDTGAPYFYMRSTPDNRLLIGGADEPFTDPDHRDSLIERKDEELMNLFKTALPDVDDTGFQLGRNIRCHKRFHAIHWHPPGSP